MRLRFRPKGLDGESTGTDSGVRVQYAKGVDDTDDPRRWLVRIGDDAVWR